MSRSSEMRALLPLLGETRGDGGEVDTNIGLEEGLLKIIGSSGRKYLSGHWQMSSDSGV